MATLREATAVDIPKIVTLDLSANLDHPVVLIPWAKPSDAPNQWLSHFQWYWTQPQYHFLVATIDFEIVGFILYHEYIEPGTAEEWEPEFPEGTDMKFFGYLFGLTAQNIKTYDQKGCYELESVAVSPEHQRKGIGALLMKQFTEMLDQKKAPCVLRGSESGKPLYEKFGWKVVSEFCPDLKDWGWEDGRYRSWHMRRENVTSLD